MSRYFDPRGTEIKRCPFCGGGEQDAPAVVHEGTTHTYVCCSYCEARTRRYKNPWDAIEAWNRRARG